ncbi:MAG: CidA/LrgA family protein [Rhodocyclaceae bacterium]
MPALVRSAALLTGLTFLLLFQLAGEVLVQALALPLPGPVLGLMLMFLALLVQGKVPPPLREASSGILQHFSILFVPAGAGVLLHAERIGTDWLPIAAALLVSTLLSIAVTALTLRLLMRVRQRADR